MPLFDSAARAEIVPNLPDELYIETTNRCNLKCRTCPQYWGMDEASADLDDAQVRRILDLFPGVRRVVLHGIGEPLLNPDLPRIIAGVKDRRAYALFNTNGLLLRGDIAARIAASGLDELRVSIDAASPHTYERVRGANGFARIIDNVRAFNALRSAPASGPKVSLWITGMRTNIVELPALVETAHEIGVREVYLQRLVFSDRGLATGGEALFRRSEAAELEAIARATERAAALGIELRGSGEATAAASVSASGSYRACRRPWTLMYVTANGNVLPCCIAPFTGVPYGDIVLGNVFTDAPEVIWNGSAYRSWRRRLLSDAPPAACAGCGSGWSL
jgi:MoaA/NifB/PqqE/SkfB family radical SAM enzyme